MAGIFAGSRGSYRLGTSSSSSVCALPIAICRKFGDAMLKSTGISRPASSIYWIVADMVRCS